MNTIETYLESKGLSYRSYGKNISKEWIGLNCIFCGADPSYHLGINKKSGKVNCWLCGGKSLLKLIQKIERCSWQDAKQILNRINLYKDEEEKETNHTSLNAVSQIFNRFQRLNSQGKEYLKSRNFDADQLEMSYNIRDGGTIGNWKYNIIFPIYMNGYLVSLVGRNIYKKKYKILSNEKSIIPRRELIFNLDSVKDTIVLVEGIFDAIRIGDAACCIFGINFSKVQLETLCKRNIKRAFIIFDAEEKAQSMAKRLGEILGTIGKFEYVENIELESGDPADLTEEDVKYLRKELML